MKKSPKTLKAVLSSILAVALVVCLSASAFAAGTGKDSGWSDIGKGSNNGAYDDFYGYGDYGYGDYFGDYGDHDDYDDFYGDFDGFYGFGDFFCPMFGDWMSDYPDIDEILEGIEDKDLKAEIQKLYDEYVEASEKADSAWAALEEALKKNGLVSGYEDSRDMDEDSDYGDYGLPLLPSDDDGAKTPGMDSKDASNDDYGHDDEDLFEEFMKWYWNEYYNA